VCGTRHSGQTCEQPYLAEHAVEEAVARYYARTVKFDAARVAELEDRLTQSFELILTYRKRQLAGERTLLTRLQTERRRLLDAHLAGAVPLDLFSEKQHELSGQIATIQAKLDAAERGNRSAKHGLALARKLLHQAGEAYHEADPIAQRAWNQAFFTRLFVKPELDGEPEVAAAELTEPFAQLLSEDLATALERVTAAQPATLVGGGSNVDQIVETAGIEPASAVAWPQRLRA